MRDALSGFARKIPAGAALTGFSAIVAFSNVNAAYANFEDKLMKLRDASTTLHGVEAGEAAVAFRRLLTAVSGGTAEDISNLALLAYVYRCLIPQLNQPHWQGE